MNRVLFVLYLLVTACLLCCSCGTKIKADISSYGETQITISGLLDEDFTVTPNELAALECVTKNETGKTEKAGTVGANGPLLDTFLEKYGKKRSDFTKIRFLALDEYRITLKGKYLTDNYTPVLSIAEGNNPLPEGYQPLRLLIPKAPSSYWIYAVIQIEFIAE